MFQAVVVTQVPHSYIASTRATCNKKNDNDYFTTRHSEAVSPSSTKDRFEIKELTTTSQKVLSQRTSIICHSRPEKSQKKDNRYQLASLQELHQR